MSDLKQKLLCKTTSHSNYNNNVNQKPRKPCSQFPFLSEASSAAERLVPDNEQKNHINCAILDIVSSGQKNTNAKSAQRWNQKCHHSSRVSVCLATTCKTKLNNIYANICERVRHPPILSIDCFQCWYCCMYTVYCVFCLLLKAATLLKSLLLRLWKHQLQRL